jgi:N-acetylglucosaminyldiphosphoundecaprenol N-acetyl-beta-D-mannosaminyltransferase
MLSDSDSSVRDCELSTPPTERRPRIEVGGVWLDALTEREVIDVVREGWSLRHGGSIFTANTDRARAAAHDPTLAELVSAGSLLADGMPLVWAARLAGQALPERITGSSLVLSLSEAAAADGQSVFLFGGADGVRAQAAKALRNRISTLRIAGADFPPLGFDQTQGGIRQAVSAITNAAPKLVCVGLGFPRQEQLIQLLQLALPETWFLACGAGIPMAAGVFKRASSTLQRMGLEWIHRLLLEPLRLAGRCLRHDLAFAIGLMVRSDLRRLRRHPGTLQARGQRT